MGCCESRGTGRDECSVDPVVLGPLQVHAGVSFDLHGLQYDDLKACLAPVHDGAVFVTPAGLDADAADVGFSEVICDLAPTAEPIVDLPGTGGAVECASSFAFAASIPAVVVEFCIFVVPAL